LERLKKEKVAAVGVKAKMVWTVFEDIRITSDDNDVSE